MHLVHHGARGRRELVGGERLPRRPHEAGGHADQSQLIVAAGRRLAGDLRMPDEHVFGHAFPPRRRGRPFGVRGEQSVAGLREHRPVAHAGDQFRGLPVTQVDHGGRHDDAVLRHQDRLVAAVHQAHAQAALVAGEQFAHDDGDVESFGPLRDVAAEEQQGARVAGDEVVERWPCAALRSPGARPVPRSGHSSLAPSSAVSFATWAARRARNRSSPTRQASSADGRPDS